MPRENAEDTHSREALELANTGIALGTAGDHDQAVLSWRMASDYADAHLKGEDIDYWIKSGLGAALYDAGEFRESIAVSELALDWCSTIKQPLPALTIARSCLRLGDVERARRSLDHARGLVGDAILDQLDAADRKQMEGD